MDDPFEELEIEELVEDLNVFLKKLKPQDKEIFEHSFGINGKTKKKAKEIAIIYGITEENVWQTKNRIMRKLKEFFEI